MAGGRFSFAQRILRKNRPPSSHRRSQRSVSLGTAVPSPGYDMSCPRASASCGQTSPGPHTPGSPCSVCWGCHTCSLKASWEPMEQGAQHGFEARALYQIKSQLGPLEAASWHKFHNLSASYFRCL